jgi:hypothetical protein
VILTKVFASLAFAAALVCGYMGARSTSSFMLRQEEPATYWPRSGTRVVRSHVFGRGLVFYHGRSEYADFAGGGPGGSGK